MKRQQPLRQAEPCIPCLDIWPLSRMDAAVRGAYDALSKRGEITVQKIRVNKSQNLCVMEYLSTCPPDWTRQALKAEKERRALANKERTDRFATRNWPKD